MIIWMLCPAEESSFILGNSRVTRILFFNKVFDIRNSLPDYAHDKPEGMAWVAPH